MFMTRLFLITLLILLNGGPAYAEWVAVAKTDDQGMTTYVDRDTIRHKGNVVKLRELADFKTVQTGVDESFLSFKVQSEYDCAEDRHRTLALTYFSGNMGRGNVVFSDSDEQKWEPVQPGSVDQILWKVACAKK
jgi:hypothetical protein